MEKEMGKKRTGELLDRLITFGTPLALLLYEGLKTITNHPKIQETIVEHSIKVLRGGRTRGDEMVFYASLLSLNISETIKAQFLDKHFELNNPNFTGKSKEEIRELRRKEELAKGLVFLIAEDCKPDKNNKFPFAEKVWYLFFLGINGCKTDQERSEFLEKRILQVGKNHQEGRTLKDVDLSKIKEQLLEIVTLAKDFPEKAIAFDAELAKKIPVVEYYDPGFMKGIFGFNFSDLQKIWRKRGIK
jgi:hypothetical protein